MATYLALQTSIDLDGLYDLIEMQQLDASWSAAAHANATWAAERARSEVHR